MLIKDFYKVNGQTTDAEGNHIFDIALNTEHDVYKGHFPERPITPGVCNIQMIKECAEVLVGKSLTLTQIDKCRLTAMVTPNGSPNLKVKVQISEANPLKINASIFFEDTIYMTLTGSLESKN